MKKVFEKYGVLKCIGSILDILGIILVVIAMPLANESVETILRLTGILMIIIGTFAVFFDNIKEKTTKVGLVGSILLVLSFVLIAISAFIDETNSDLLNADVIVKLAAMTVFVVGGLCLSLTAKEHRFIKSLFVIIAAIVVFTWLVPYGYFNGSDFYDYGMKRIGIMDISVAIYNALYYCVDKVVYLFILAGFYGVLSKISGYQKMVSGLATKFAKHPILVSIIMSVLIFVLTSLFSQTLIVLLFIPLFISILLNMKIDKLTTFAITFGSVLVGILGATYGTEGLTMFNYYITYYTGLDVATTGLTYRFIIAAVALVLYNFFICMCLKKVLKENNKDSKNADEQDDPFRIEISKKKTSVIPVAVVLFVLAVVTILCYINWNDNFGIAIFTEFHEWLTELAPVEDFFIMSYLLGSNAQAFGEYTYVFAICSVMLIAIGLIAYLYRMKFNEFIEAFYNGTKKMFKPICYVAAVYLVFGLCYNTPFMAYISNWMFNLVEGFNPFITSLLAFISSVFHNDLGFTSFLVAPYIANVYSSNLDLVHTIYMSMYGVIQMFMPTSFMLALGLSLMKLDYKSWLKYIWLFVVGMIVILLVLFTVVTYI